MTFFCGAVGRCRWSLTYGGLTDDDLRGYVANVQRLTTAGARILVLDIAHEISLPTPTQRRAVADAVAALPRKDLIDGHAVVTSSAIARGVLTAINWFVGDRTFPEKLFGSPIDGLKWLAEKSPGLDVDAILTSIGETAPRFRTFSW